MPGHIAPLDVVALAGRCSAGEAYVHTLLVGAVANSDGAAWLAHKPSCTRILQAAARRLPCTPAVDDVPGVFHILRGALPTSLLRTFQLFQSSGGFGGVFYIPPLAAVSLFLSSWLNVGRGWGLPLEAPLLCHLPWPASWCCHRHLLKARVRRTRR